MTLESLKDKNIKSFSSPEAVEAYSSTYIRTSEEYVIKTYMPLGSFVLDVGCGTGRTTAYIRDNKCNVIGIDLAEPLIVRARKLYPDIEFAVMDASNLTYADNTFDTVFFSFNGIDNFSSLDERHGAIKELMRVLKPGGFFIYSSHNSIAIPRSFSKCARFIKNIAYSGIGPHWRAGDYGFGDLFQYYNNVWNESRQLRGLGLQITEIVSNGKVARLPRFLMPFLERFPTYIVKK